MLFFSRITENKHKKYTNKKINKETIQRCSNILSTLEYDLAKRVRERMCMAYGFVNYGFYVDASEGCLKVRVFTFEEVLIDEFMVEVDFLSMHKKDLLCFLSEQVNDELYRIYSDTVYM